MITQASIWLLAHCNTGAYELLNTQAKEKCLHPFPTANIRAHFCAAALFAVLLYAATRLSPASPSLSVWDNPEFKCNFLLLNTERGGTRFVVHPGSGWADVSLCLIHRCRFHQAPFRGAGKQLKCSCFGSCLDEPFHTRSPKVVPSLLWVTPTHLGHRERELPSNPCRWAMLKVGETLQSSPQASLCCRRPWR